MAYAIQSITRNRDGEIVFLCNWGIDSEDQRKTLALLLEINPAYISKVQEGCPAGIAKLIVSEDQTAVDFLHYFLDYGVVGINTAREAFDWLEQSLRNTRNSATRQQNSDCERDN